MLLLLAGVEDAGCLWCFCFPRSKDADAAVSAADDMSTGTDSSDACQDSGCHDDMSDCHDTKLTDMSDCHDRHLEPLGDPSQFHDTRFANMSDCHDRQLEYHDTKLTDITETKVKISNVNQINDRKQVKKQDNEWNIQKKCDKQDSKQDKKRKKDKQEAILTDISIQNSKGDKQNSKQNSNQNNNQNSDQHVIFIRTPHLNRLNSTLSKGILSICSSYMLNLATYSPTQRLLYKA